MYKDIKQSIFELSIVAIIFYGFMYIITDIRVLFINWDYIFWQAWGLISAWMVLFLMKQWDNRSKTNKNRYVKYNGPDRRR